MSQKDAIEAQNKILADLLESQRACEWYLYQLQQKLAPEAKAVPAKPKKAAVPATPPAAKTPAPRPSRKAAAKKK